MKIKTGDMVKVISGHYKGTTGEVKAVSPKTNKIIVEGVNLVKKSLKEALGKFDAAQYGGAPVLGLKSLVVKMHGSAKAQEVTRAVEQCVQFYQEDIAAKITEYLEKS